MVIQAFENVRKTIWIWGGWTELNKLVTIRCSKDLSYLEFVQIITSNKVVEFNIIQTLYFPFLCSMQTTQDLILISPF